jgi:hypothetical protein
MESNRLTIIVNDKAVYREQGVLMNLDLSTCGIPSEVHALQWSNNQGHIEYAGPVPNEDISQLPEWANNCVAVWETAYQSMIDSQGAV